MYTNEREKIKSKYLEVWVGEGKDRLGERLIYMFVAVTNLWNERAQTTRVKLSRSHTVLYNQHQVSFDICLSSVGQPDH